MLQGTQELTGIQKASVLLMSLSADESARVLEKLSPIEREMIGAQIVKLRHVDSIMKQRVLDEAERLRGKPVRHIIDTKDGEPIAQSGPLKWLEGLKPEAVAGMLSSERAQNIALVLANLSPKAAANVLSYLGEKTRNQVTLRLASIRPVSSEAIEAVDSALRLRWNGSESGAVKKTQGTIAGILGHATDRVRTSVLAAMSLSESATIMGPREPLKSPEDIAELTKQEIRAVLGEVKVNDLCIVLKVGSDALKSALLNAAPDDIRQMLQDELDAPTQVKLREIEAAERRVVEALRSLQERGVIHGRPSAAEVRVE